MNKDSFIPRLALTVVCAMALSCGAHAKPNSGFSGGGLCSEDAQTTTYIASGDINEGDLTLNGNDADDCYGLVEIGGNVQDEIDSINALGWGDQFSADYFIKDDGSGSVTETFLGMTWELSAPNGASSGLYTLTVVDNDPAPPSLPFTVDIIGFMKASTEGAFFLFNDVVIDTSNSGEFQISWTTGNNGGNPGLSGLSLFIGEPGGGGGPGGGGVPIPGTLLLLAFPMVGLAWQRRG